MLKHFSYIQMIMLLLAAMPLNTYANADTINDSLPAPDIYYLRNKLMANARIIDYDVEKSDAAIAVELDDIERDCQKTGNNKLALNRLLRTMHVRKILRTQKTVRRLYTDMAYAGARLHLYPAAMQWYYQSVYKEDSDDDFMVNPSFTIDTGIVLSGNDWDEESIPEDIADIVQSFNDGKEALSCALVLHVKQPSPGKRNAFAGLNKVGHMFITLIKYNADKSIVCHSFGFYPNKENLFSATPFQPIAESVIKDDALHNWDEMAGKFISYRRFQKILRLLKKFDNKKYHLNSNNCTDFGLYAAEIGGIDIKDTRGKWPFGRGNNPASAGQSILEGKIINTDTGTKEGLFLCIGKLAVVHQPLK